MTPEDINITVEAQGAETRQLVASLISNRLTEVGFTNVDVGLATRDDQTSNTIDAEVMPSLLDAMKEANPAVFARPVSILAMPFSDIIDGEKIVHVSLMKDRPDMVEPADDRPEYSPGWKAAVLDIARQGEVSPATIELISEEKAAGTFVGNEEQEAV
ncbi:hypothetical protein [Burkholderia phage FLC9]|nr:hypothetical protein [Burkholderia phage FLC9]